VGAHLAGAILLVFAARQTQFKPLLAVMFLYSVCFAATMPLVNAALFNKAESVNVANVFIWAPIAWALIGWLLTGWRMTRKKEGDGSDCLYFAAALSVLMVLACLFLPKNPPEGDAASIIKAFTLLGEMNFLVFLLLSMVIAGMMQFYFLGSAQFMQDMGISSKYVPASMALAQIVQAIATALLMMMFVENLGFKWTLTIGAGCWLLLFAVYVIGQPRPLIIGCQPLHGLAYVFFIIVGQMCANEYADAETISSLQGLIFAATTGLGLFLGTQLAGFVMDKSSVEGKFQWTKVWTVPCLILLVGVLALATVFQNPPPKAAAAAETSPEAAVSASEKE
jgi:hypothetical protein